MAPVVEDIAPAPPVFHAEQAHVDVCTALAPAVAYTAQASVDVCIAPQPIAYSDDRFLHSRACCDQHCAGCCGRFDLTLAAPIPGDDFTHTVERIIGVPVPQFVEEVVPDVSHAASASSSAPSPRWQPQAQGGAKMPGPTLLAPRFLRLALVGDPRARLVRDDPGRSLSLSQATVCPTLFLSRLCCASFYPSLSLVRPWLSQPH